MDGISVWFNTGRAIRLEAQNNMRIDHSIFAKFTLCYHRFFDAG